jgi:hypothetical protein
LVAAQADDVLVGDAAPDCNTERLCRNADSSANANFVALGARVMK